MNLGNKDLDNIEKWISLIHKKAKEDPKIQGMIWYGSSLESDFFRDIDIALFGSPNLSSQELFQLRIEYLKDIPDFFDIQIFNLLPVAVQHEVLKGKVIFVENFAYELAYRSIQEFEDFEKYLEEYRDAYLNVN
ncbi:MAG: hypothetical protein ACTSVK_03860 [Promethearchaeota archaeon]